MVFLAFTFLRKNLGYHGTESMFIDCIKLFVRKYNFLVLLQQASMSEKDLQLRAEIKRLLKEAAALSQPSTFAQAAKLRRAAAAKEKELAKTQETLTMEMKSSFGLYERILMISQVLRIFFSILVCHIEFATNIYICFLQIVVFTVLTLWLWRVPVAAISKELVQPFGNSFVSL
ncbi:hypothetical protein HanHA300_Chr09g0321131 [Helianthus annuus]|nr:hypothetical protein HanHA300_Chr09g0321131 [Helianthus annuus]